MTLTGWLLSGTVVIVGLGAVIARWKHNEMRLDRLESEKSDMWRAIYRLRIETGLERPTEDGDEEDESWAEERVAEILADLPKTTLLDFPGFPLWGIGTEYRDAESKWHHGPLGWYGIANEFGGSYLPDGWYEIASKFGENVHPSADTASPNHCFGRHEVGPEPDQTSALLAIKRYVRALEAEREREKLDIEKETFGPSETR